MKLSIKGKFFLLTAIFVLIFIITNPSTRAFKEYIGTSTYSGLHKDKNFFVVSVFKYDDMEYVGFLGNFWKQTNKTKTKANINVDLKIDTSAKMDSADLSDTIFIDNKSLCILRIPLAIHQ